jgi:hypothetical protein
MFVEFDRDEAQGCGDRADAAMFHGLTRAQGIVHHDVRKLLHFGA